MTVEPPMFQRARSEEQRAERRERILATATTMLESRRVADLSLNELARQVGLAKSNVLHYFESREAVLLELYGREYQSWLIDLDSRLTIEQNSNRSLDLDTVARAIADTVADRPVLCELTAASAGVLEHNVSAEVAAEYKKSAISNSYRLAELVGSRIGPFPNTSALVFVAAVSIIIGGVWASSQPSEAMAAAYAAHPELRSMQIDFRTAVRELVATVLAGLRERIPRA
jgi:AcrR family transcriptional regulator